MSAPASRPVHPCVVSLTDSTRAAEFAIWAHITKKKQLPNLVTASASSIAVYSVCDATGTLLLAHSFGNIAGSIISLHALPSSNNDEPDALLVGFAGHARLTILTIQTATSTDTTGELLQAVTLLDLTPAVNQFSFGATAVLEHDMIVATTSSSKGHATAACVLGGGVAVAVCRIQQHHHHTSYYWKADPPYILPLKSLHLPHHNTQEAAASVHTNFGNSMSTGFGDILDVSFLQGFLEPVVLLLHTDPGGSTATGRLGSGAPCSYVTALSVSVQHSRTAVLWSATVPSDAFAVSAADSVVVRGANTLTFVTASGEIKQCMAVNGWARATTAGLEVTRNAAIRLAIALDGSRMSWLSSSSAIVSLRGGQLYVLQKTNKEWSLLPTGQTLGAVGEVATLVTLPLQHYWSGSDHRKAASWLGKMDHVGAEKELSMGLLFAGSRLGDSLLLGFALETVTMPWENISNKKGEEIVKKEEEQLLVSAPGGGTALSEDQEEILRLEDEALYAPTGAVDSRPDVVPPSSDDDEMAVEGSPTKRTRVSTQFTVVRALTPLDALVNLGPLGPSCEGPLSKAPEHLTAEETTTAVTAITTETKAVLGASAHVFPSGYGSSGGIALVTVPGRDDRMIVSEEDCLNASCIFSLSSAGIVLLGMSDKVGGGGIKVLRAAKVSNKDIADKQKDEYELCEVDVAESCSETEIFQSALLSAGEFSNGHVVFIVRELEEKIVAVVASTATGGKLEILKKHPVEMEGGSTLVNVTPIVSGLDSDVVSFGCLWSCGKASVVSLRSNGALQTYLFKKESIADEMDVDGYTEADDMKEFYSDFSVASIDVFKAPKAAFQRLPLEQSAIEEEASAEKKEAKPAASSLEMTTAASTHPEITVEARANEASVETTDWSKLTVKKLKEELKKRGLPAPGRKADLVAALEESDRQSAVVNSNENQTTKAQRRSPDEELAIEEPTPRGNNATAKNAAPAEANGFDFKFDEEDEELYAIGDRTGSLGQSGSPSLRSSLGRVGLGDEAVYVAISRKSGDLEVYSLSKSLTEPTLCWSARGAALGASLLGFRPDETEGQLRLPRSHKVTVTEMRFFSCGPTTQTMTSETFSSQSHCIAIETSNGDLDLYRLEDDISSEKPSFRRMPLRLVARPSKEQARHRAKLVRKGALGKDQKGENDVQCFRYNGLHPFTEISGQNGLFAAGPRPLWFVAERGMPTALSHRPRHAAPAGGKPRPVCGFCSGLKGQGGYVTLHERVGRVGSQRFTLFRGLSSVFDSHGLLPGSGYCVEKIPMGVTVRRILFIDDESVSTGDRPLYAVLVSREVEVDQSEFNSDGLTPEERQRIEQEKEADKIQKQVEADLGGFDMDSEWVEEIERENCFKVDMELGGAPPIHQSMYSLWIVDAANKWMVVDSYELGEHEHGIDLQIMTLTEFKEEPGSSATTTVDDDTPKRLFVTVGTGIVNHNGEDVATKGRVLLFEVKRTKLGASSVIELELFYEKNIFHGPVTTLSCLSSEGRNRLVVGAGSDVNIEQWGSSGKLTQVGFFRATMHIMDIMHFKNFLLLSDAYDSMFFLVWRESDKSLTLLAKDYDPIPVYASGIMTRGAAMTLMCHDDRQNLQFFQYTPGEAAARGGNKLVCRADFHLGSQTTAFRSHFCRPSLIVHSATPASTLAALKQQDALFGRQDDDQRLGVHFGTTDGGLGSIVPLSEPVYWRLMALQSVMANALESDCALSQRAWRLYRRSPRRGGCRSNDRKKGVIDGDLVLKYVDLATTEQEDIASAIGSTVELILDNLLELQCGSMIL